jgi:hypothetical protein
MRRELQTTIEHHVTKLVAPPAVTSERTWYRQPRSVQHTFRWRSLVLAWPFRSAAEEFGRAAMEVLSPFLRLTDSDRMSMEARQNLGFAADPRRYSAIEIEIQNADPCPGSVSLVLKIRNIAGDRQA